MARCLRTSMVVCSSLLCAAAQGQNLLVNGDFEQGNTGFVSGYTFTDNVRPEGTYYVGANPFHFHTGAASYPDHTSGNGLMLIINGSREANVTVWEQTVAVANNQTYDFSSWAASWGNENNRDPNPAQLRFYINGAPVGSDFTLVAENGLWTQFSAQWNSGSNASATIRIVDMNQEGSGNDFTLDDLMFGGAPSAVPEPSAWVIGAIGIASGLRLACKRRRKA